MSLLFRSVLIMLIVSSIFIVILASATSAMDILIFGGNGFIGSHVSERLLDSGHRLTLVSSKGSFFWDTRKTVESRIIRHYTCDRYNPSRCGDDLWTLLDNAGSHFDAVIDFSAYRVEAVQPFYERLVKSIGDGNEKRLLYIYISTDSVYEVCIRPSEERLLVETDSVRPTEEAERVQLARKDSYGDRKLQIEEYLIDQRRNHNGLPYTILRLPDVLGERDSTQRWWKYQLWLRYGQSVDHPVQVPTFARSLATSYVDVKDVGAVIELVISQRSKSQDEIFNVGFPKPIGLLELLSEMKIHSGASESAISNRVPPSNNEGDEIVTYFPSVTRGALDVSKAQAQLGWKPSMEFAAAVQRISKFYLDAESQFESELVDTARSLMRDLNLNSDEKKRFLEAIRHKNSPSDAKKRKLHDEF